MKKRVTMADIANAAGVSQSSVSLILSKKKSATFSESTVEKVLKACRDLNYQVSEQPRNITSNTIMIISENLAVPYYTQLTQHIENIAHLHGYRSLICNTNRNKSFEASYLEMAMEMQVAGIICLTYPHSPEKFNKASKTLPIVAVCDRTENFSVDIVEMNNYQSSILLVDHLVKLGHKKIMLLTASTDINLGRRTRLKGLRHQMAQYGLEDTFYVHSKEVDWQSEMAGQTNDYEFGYALMQDPYAMEKGVTAFIGMNDMVARGITDALIEKDKRVPEDYSVCGYDNLLYARLLPVSLTSVDPHIDQKGRAAFELLQRQIKIMHHDESTDFQEGRLRIEYPPELVVRSSTGPAAK